LALPFAPREVARSLLRDNAALFRWSPDLPDLLDGDLLERPHGWSARLRQEFKGLPVDVSEIVVNVTGDGRVPSGYSQYHYDIPASLDPERVRLSETDARQRVAALARTFTRREIGRPILKVHRFRPLDRGPAVPARRVGARARFLVAVRAALARARRPRIGTYVLAWDVSLETENPRTRWRVLIDAVNGRLLEVRDAVAYAQANGSVFDPNPIVTSGDLSLSSRSTAAILNAQRVTVTLPRLDPAPADGRLRLDGSWVHMADSSRPNVPEPSSATGHFVFGSSTFKFLDVMAYYHIDRFQDYMQSTLGVPSLGNWSVSVDPQGEAGADGSTGGGGGLSFGTGGIHDASDAMVILHEYGHFLQDAAVPGSSTGNFASGVAEGFCDFLAAAYYDDKHKDPEKTRGLMFSWDANPTDAFWAGRRYDSALPLSGAQWEQCGGGYQKAEVWCSAMFELYRKLGGDSTDASRQQAARDLTIRIHLVANSGVPRADATVEQMAFEVETAAANLGGWRYPDALHRKVIYDTFQRRAADGFAARAVDVYIDDGRGGRYGSASGNDTFREALWIDEQDDAPDVWVAAGTTSGSPTDHVPRPVRGAAAFVFARVKNRGSTASGAVIVKAFASAPGSARRWPIDWIPLPAPGGPMPATIAPAPAAGAIVGPFPWTPTVAGAQSLLVVVESAEDRALTQDLAAGVQLDWMDLVPFDNNIAVRTVTVKRS
jgi:hypothetical protein